ncbi:MAG: DNA translocase FtsK 4TM domain-containing protein, partial [Marinobacter sp.]|nr:DNA translocase FtsK 4TM domain-containing protein [Marinobacter sp.]
QSSGGVLGTAVSEAMVRFFNLPATTLLLIAIFLFALTVTTGLSWFWLMDKVGGLTLQAGQSVLALFKGRSGETETTAKPEPPVVKDRIPEADTDSEKKRGWLRRLFKRGDKQENTSDKAGTQRKEPALEGFTETHAEPTRLESFTARDKETVEAASEKESEKPANRS